MIGTYNESILHRKLKELYAQNGKIEETVEGYVCDVRSNDGTLIEIQTKNLSKMKKKLESLLPHYKIHLVHPIARETLLEIYDEQGNFIRKRKSPLKKNIYTLFNELTGIFHLLCHPNFTLEVVFITQKEKRIKSDTIKNRNHSRIMERLLESIEQSQYFKSIEDYKALIPTLPVSFSVKQLKDSGIGKNAGKMAWVLRKMNIIEIEKKVGNAYFYKIKATS